MRQHAARIANAAWPVQGAAGRAAARSRESGLSRRGNHDAAIPGSSRQVRAGRIAGGADCCAHLARTGGLAILQRRALQAESAELGRQQREPARSCDVGVGVILLTKQLEQAAPDGIVVAARVASG